jgi:TRAP-type transport system periplasmic protein
MHRIALLLLLPALLLGCGVKEDDGVRVLRLGHASLPGKPLFVAAEAFKREAEKRSAGRLRIEVYPAAMLGDARLLMESVAIGTLDMTADAPLSTFVPEMALLDLPYIFYDADHAAENLDGAFGKALARRAEPRGMMVLGYWANGSRYIFNSKRDILTPDDLKGLKIRVPEGRVWIEMMNRFGAMATPLSWGELYTGLEQGVVDGAESDPISIKRASLHIPCKHLSRTDHIYNVCPHIIHKKTFDSLPPDLQQVLREASQAAAQENRSYMRENFEKTCQELEAQGVKIVDVNRGLFQEKVRPMRDNYAAELKAEDLVGLLTPPPLGKE